MEVMLIGQFASQESSAVIDASFPAAEAARRLTKLPDLPTAIGRLKDHATLPHLIVLPQNRPGEFSHTQLDALQAAAPLARMVILLDSWCEGEARSGKPWPGAIRCYWHQWPARFAQEMARIAAGLPGSWSLPATSTPEERLLATLPLRDAGIGVTPKSLGLLAILAENAETGAALADAAKRRGYQTVLLRSGRDARISGAVAALWDTRPELVVEPGRVEQVRDAIGDAPIVAIAGFPRPGDVARARDAGVAAVMSKPLLLGDLFWQIEQVRSTSGRKGRTRFGTAD